ncbi:MAG TPA: hypothetical protein VKA35_01295 [Solirubrobacterales bacterium]|nr:hypothetical protein [Solirubrobacterales bacterium]
MPWRGAALAAIALTTVAPGEAAADFGFLPGSGGFEVAAEQSDGTAANLAGSHPHVFRAELRFEVEGDASDGDLRDLAIELPPGFLVNPEAVGECSAAAFQTPRVSPYEVSDSGESCPNSTQVGTVAVDVGGTIRHFGLFNLVPPFGTPAAFGFAPFGVPVVFAARVRDSDAGMSLELSDLQQSLDLRELALNVWGSPWQPAHDAERGSCLNEETGGSHGSCLVLGNAPAPETHVKSYLTLPTTPCGSPFEYLARAASWQGEGAAASASTPPLSLCRTSLSTARVQLMTEAAAARTGLAFNLDVNDGGGILNPGGVARPAIKKAIVSLPDGLTVNPSLGSGLRACGEADYARESAASVPGSGCPNGSKIGTVRVDGPLGLADPLIGSVYIAEPYRNPFGTLLAVYLVARSPRRGLIVKSSGKIEPDPRSGRLQVTLDQLPRLLYTHFSLTLREGQRSTLLSPPLCGSYQTQLSLSSWADPDAFRSESAAFAIRGGEGGGPCPPGGVPGFRPGLLAGSINSAAGAYSPFYLRMTRTDGEQEITSYSASFPPGLLGGIAGIPECPEAAIAAAKARSGTEEQAGPSCPAASQVGHTMAGFGVGGVLAWAPGNLYLAGPYHGAPLSIVAVDSALIGPFDLGTVVVRSAIRIDPGTAQARIDSAGSDPIPHILGGIPLHLRDIRVYVDRPQFMLNPTSCDPTEITSTLTGAGGDLFGPQDDSSASSAQRFQVLGCGALGFKPRLSMRLLGSTRHGAYPGLRAIYRPRPGGANLRAVSVTLPPAFFLAQEHLETICTRAQFATSSCPPGSVYGRARALTPLLAEPLQGPVYLRASSNRVPDLVADLRGHGIQIEVVGRIDTARGGIRASFEGLPDAPVSSFVMTLRGGKRGLLQNAEAACRRTLRANARWIAQSNATAILRPKIAAKCGQRARRKPGRGQKPGHR